MRLKNVLLFVCLIVAGFAGNGAAQNFASAVNYGTQVQPLAIATGDFNHDHNLDLVVANSGSSSLSIFLGNGDGTFTGPANLPITSPPGSSGGTAAPLSVAVADFDGDGIPDLIVSFAGSADLQLLHGNGDGSFQFLANIPLSGVSSPPAIPIVPQVVAVDFNQDGKPDLAVATFSGIQILLNDGSGNFTLKSTVLAGQATQNFAVADFNLDGHLDLAVNVFSGNSGNVLVVLGNGDGTFQPAASIPLTPKTPIGIAASDLNRDGRPDIVVSDFSGPILVALQQSDGSFIAASPLNAIPHPGNVLIGDFDGDGNPDLAVVSNSANATAGQPDAVLVFRGFGTGSFAPPSQFDVASGPIAFVAASFTNTVSQDIATADVSANMISVLVNQGANSLSLISSKNPAVFSQSVNLTATVHPKFSTAPTPTGIVTFTDGSQGIGSASLDSSGAATLTVNPPAGIHAIKAIYEGSKDFVGGSSAQLSQTVTRATPGVVLAGNPNPSVFGQTVVFTITVGLPGAPANPSGTVTLTDAGTVIAERTLDTNGIAAISVASFLPGTHSLVAQYSGDANYTSAASAALAQTVNKSPTVTTLTTFPNPSVFGQSIAMRVLVASSGDGHGIPSGNVTFIDGGSSIGTTTLAPDGTATLNMDSLAVGTHSITANYGSDPNFLASTSPVVSQNVTKIPTTTSITAGPNPAVFGQFITLKALVSSSGAVSGVPTGNVIFSDGANPIGTATLTSNGIATLNIASLAVGTHIITASYFGDPDFLSSASISVSQTVNKSATSTALNVTPVNPLAGQPVTLTVAVEASGSGSGTPSGSVTFSDGTTSLGTATLANGGKATFVLQSLAVGSHSLAAAYSGNGSFLPSTSIPDVLTVPNPDFSLSLQQTSAQIAAGQQFTTHLTLTPLNGLAGLVSTVCTGAPAASRCTITPDTTSLDGTTAATATLTIITTGSPTNATASLPLFHRRGIRPEIGAGTFLSLLFGLLLIPNAQKRKLMLTSIFLLAVLAGCGGGSSPGSRPISGNTPPGVYMMTVQSQSGKLMHSVQFLLTVK